MVDCMLVIYKDSSKNNVHLTNLYGILLTCENSALGSLWRDKNYAYGGIKIGVDYCQFLIKNTSFKWYVNYSDKNNL